jgi:hypothetical protein
MPFCQLCFYVGDSWPRRPRSDNIHEERNSTIFGDNNTYLNRHNKDANIATSVTYFTFGFPTKKSVLVCKHPGADNYTSPRVRAHSARALIARRLLSQARHSHALRATDLYSPTNYRESLSAYRHTLVLMTIYGGLIISIHDLQFYGHYCRKREV